VPVHNQFALDKRGRPSPLGLQLAGAAISVEIAVPSVLAQRLAERGEPVPAPRVGQALIDTGASLTAVDEDALKALGLQPTGRIRLATPSQADGPASIYPVRMTFPQTAISVARDGLSVAGVILRHQGYVALLGRNLLARAVFTYNGPGGFFTVAF